MRSYFKVLLSKLIIRDQDIRFISFCSGYYHIAETRKYSGNENFSVSFSGNVKRQILSNPVNSWIVAL